MLKINKNEYINPFEEKDYSVEHQVYSSDSEIGNYDVQRRPHYKDSQESEEAVYYFICNEEGYKYYNLEFTNENELETFIAYAMRHQLVFEDLKEDESLANFYKRAAAESDLAIPSNE